MSGNFVGRQGKSDCATVAIILFQAEVWSILMYCYAPTIGKGAISIAFVCLSVHLSDLLHTHQIIQEPKV